MCIEAKIIITIMHDRSGYSDTVYKVGLTSFHRTKCNKLCGWLDYQYWSTCIMFLQTINFTLFEIFKVNEYQDHLLPIKVETTLTYFTPSSKHRVELELLQHQVLLSQSHFHSPFQKYVTRLLLSYCLFSFLIFLLSAIIKHIYI